MFHLVRFINQQLCDFNIFIPVLIRYSWLGDQWNHAAVFSRYATQIRMYVRPQPFTCGFWGHWMPPWVWMMGMSCYVQLCHSLTRYVTSEECKHYTLSTKLFKHVTTSWCKHHKMFQAAAQEETCVCVCVCVVQLVSGLHKVPGANSTNFCQ